MPFEISTTSRNEKIRVRFDEKEISIIRVNFLGSPLKIPYSIIAGILLSEMNTVSIHLPDSIFTFEIDFLMTDHQTAIQALIDNTSKQND